jgi:hypothetical protein
MSKIVEPLEFELRRHAKAMDRAFANDRFCPEGRAAKFYREAHKALTHFEAEAKLLRDE